MLNIFSYLLRSYSVAGLVVTLAILIKLLLENWVEVENLFLLFLPAVMFSTWYGGLGPGLLATIITGLFSYYSFVDPDYLWLGKFLGKTLVTEQELWLPWQGVLSPKQYLELGLFILEGILFSSITGKLRASIPQVENLVRNTEAFFHPQSSNLLQTKWQSKSSQDSNSNRAELERSPLSSRSNNNLLSRLTRGDFQDIASNENNITTQPTAPNATEFLERRSTFFAKATKVLASAFDFEATLSAVVSLAVPFLADCCLIFKSEQNGQIQLVRASHQDSQKQTLLDGLVELYRTNIQHPHSFTAEVLRTGKSILVPETAYEMATSLTESNRMLEIFRELDPKSFMVVPLTARGQVFGTIMFVLTQSGRRYNHADLAIAEDLAYCAALAIDNARLYGDTQCALQQQAELLSQIDALLTGAPLAVCFLDQELRYVRINQVMAEINGFSVAQHLGHKFSELLPHQAAQLEPQFQQVLDTGKPILNVKISGEALGQEGQSGYWLGNYYPVCNADGETVGIGIIFTDITEIRQAETVTREAERKVAKILESITDAFFAVDREWRFTYINGRCAEIMQRSQTGLLGKNIWEEFPAFVKTAFYEQYHLAISQQTVVHFEAAGPQSKRWFEAHAYPVADGLAVYLRETTARKQAQKALQESEELFRAMFDQAAVGITLVRVDGQFMQINPAMCELTGYSQAELQQITFKDITHPDDLDLDLSHIQQVLTREINGYSIQKRFIRKDGSIVWVNLTSSAVWDSSGVLKYAVGIIEDISDRKRAETAQQFLLEASNVLASSLDYETTLTNIAHLSVPTLADWCIVDIFQGSSIHQLALACANPAKEHILYEVRRRYPYTEDKKHPFLEIVERGESVFYSELPDAKLAAIAQNNEHLQMLRSLGIKSVMVIPLKLYGQVFGCLSFVSADSNRRYTEADVALAQDIARRAATAIENARLYRETQTANRLKDEFLAVLSHELRTPLNSILGWAQILRSRKPDQAKSVRALETIERNAKIQKQLIDDLLDVSRIIQGKLVLNISRIDLVTVIEAAINTMRPAADAKRIEIELLVCSDLTLISGDPDRLQQVVWNLLSNAIKFTPIGGRVEVRLSVIDGTGNREQGTVISQQSTVTQYLQIQVIDTGKGISPEFLPHVFERFRQADSSFTRVYGGLGIGLAIVRHLVELHGGTVKAESAGVDLGATFTVNLPVLNEE